MLFGRKTILYFVPHQDDELLSMGADICNNVLRHNNVHVILCTDGSKLSVRNTLANGEKCSLHPGKHAYNLSSEDFIKTRDSEFFDSCRAMGVPKINIHITRRRGVDGELTVAQAENIINFYLILYGRSSTVCTLSFTNGPSQHIDHQTLGKAANNLLKRGKIQDLRFFVEPYHYEEIAENARMIPIEPTFVKASSRAQDRIKKAVESYSRWDPSKQRYAVGIHSVQKEFDDLLENMCSICYVKKDEKTMSFFSRMSYRHKKWLKLQKQKQKFFSTRPCEKPELNGLNLVTFSQGQVDEYKEFCIAYNKSIRENEEGRLADSSSFWCLVNDENTIVSSCWMTGSQRFYISENDMGFNTHSSGSALLYHFETKAEFSGKGYNSLLLRSVVSHSEKYDRFIIYTSPDDTAGEKGILKAGFTLDGSFSGGDGSLQSYLEQAGFTSISRKYRMGGLRVVE